MYAKPKICSLLAAFVLTACVENAAVTSASNIDPISLATAPPDAAPRTCWDKTVTPAVIETATSSVLLEPAQLSSDGRVQVAPVYETQEQNIVVQSRRVNWREILCPDDITPEFTASVQRALAARGYYRGPISGDMNARTTAAIRRYQKDEGLESGTLSIAAARKLGLIVIDPVPPAQG